MNEAAIIVENVYKDFRLPHEKHSTLKSSLFRSLSGKKNKTIIKQHALKDVSFTIGKGEFFGIVGRNGSGKSTLLKILAGIYQPTKGSVQVRGKLVPFIELGVGFNPELSGRENVFLNGALLGFSRREIESMYDEIVAFAELEAFMDQKLKNYSSGMQVRLAFSMAVRANAEILLVDEVLAVGDTEFQRKCFEYFRFLKKTKKTVVFVSHDMNAVKEYCDRAVLVEGGVVSLPDVPEEIAKKYTALFENTEVGQESIRQNERIGDQRCSVLYVSSDKKTYKADDLHIDLSVTIKADETVESIAVGFLIKGSNGVSILGNNTHLQGKKIPKLEKGKTVSVKWTIPNVFGDGGYSVDAAVTSTDGTVNHDWYEDATGFKVYRNERTPYIITPTIPVELTQS
jgi:ABC-2 type transport system ATP-binding protein